VLYDVTSSYFEGRSCPLGAFGHSRDDKKGKLQVVFGLLCNREGCPVAVEVFEGNTGDPTTLKPQIDKVRERFHLERVVFVGDRGMLTSARIREDLQGLDGVDWISALRTTDIRKLEALPGLQLSLFDERGFVELTDPVFPGERLVVCRNPLMADERARKREELLDATEAKLDEIVRATERPKRPLRGQDTIALRVGRVVNDYKVAKHFVLEITETSFTYRRDEEKIAAEAALDGIYVVRTSLPESAMSAEEVVGSYKGLSVVERAFRSTKTVDLHVRPIYHYLPERVRAHIFLCMLAYYLEWHLRRRLAPLLFDDDDRDEAEAQRTSVVAPAKVSASAQSKARTLRTPDGLPVHSFQTLLQALARLSKSRMRIRRADAEPIEKLSRATALQQKAFSLLGLRL
jgi:transposase